MLVFSVRRCSVKKILLKSSHNSQKNICICVSFYRGKKRLQQKCFPVNFAKYWRASILQNICKRLFLSFIVHNCSKPSWCSCVLQVLPKGYVNPKYQLNLFRVIDFGQIIFVSKNIFFHKLFMVLNWEVIQFLYR